jgi:hypothetical protein
MTFLVGGCGSKLHCVRAGQGRVADGLVDVLVNALIEQYVPAGINVQPLADLIAIVVLAEGLVFTLRNLKQSHLAGNILLAFLWLRFRLGLILLTHVAHIQ